MSAIPPNWLASIIQGHAAQNRAAEARTRDESEAVQRAHQALGSDGRTNVIDNDDRDSATYADAEGAGSQGRPCSDESTEPDEQEERPRENGGAGLDVEA